MRVFEMSRFRFIHAADVHLGSMLHMDGAQDTALASWCREATYTAFDRLCRIAVDSDARFLLISGDLYDRESRSVRASRFFADACGMLNRREIGVYVIAGNHDPLREYHEMFALPPNVHVFQAGEPEVCYVRENGETLAAIVGQSYRNKWESAPMHRGFPAPDEDCFTIAMLHTQMEAGDRKYVPCTPGELAESPFVDYFALGHIHQPVLLKEDKPVITWSGIPQGRDFGEEGPGGCWLVEVDGTGIAGMQYRMTSPVIYRRVSVDIGGEKLRDAETLSQLEEYLVDCAWNIRNDPVSLPGSHRFSSASCQTGKEEGNGENNPEGYVIRWILTGRGKLHRILGGDRQEIGQELCETLRDRLSGIEPFVWTDSVEFRTGSPVTEEVLNRHEVLRDLLKQSFLSVETEKEARESLIHELGQMWTESLDPEEQDDRKLPLDEETLQAILEDAGQRLIESLAEEGQECT
jgi:DNA repair exonuclease SbcCD nuclease subunit